MRMHVPSGRVARCRKMLRVASELLLSHTSRLLRTRSERNVLACERLDFPGKHATVSAVQVAARLGPRFDFASLS